MRRFIISYGRIPSAARLASATGCRLIRAQNSRYIPKEGDVVINWGNTTTCIPITLNKVQAVANASNKTTCFALLSAADVAIPEYTTSKTLAVEWSDKGRTVVVRHLTRASGGRGIEIVKGGGVPTAPLYTRYIKKHDEYRVHVFNDTVIDTQKKLRKLGVPDSAVDWRIRNTAGGFIFAREGIDTNSRRNLICRAAVAALGLDFGAVDVIYNAHHNQYYVLEINTAPGLEGTTLDIYSDRINSYLGEQDV